ncbi:MAG: metallophosphoesterase [Acetobacter sp.]|jgi:3',5'-cyclic AMP phosphodiesterase CpdA|nr:metallophosphoesterase [Acetobacter sp.]MCH4061588.1 metallophosphoesterase [Acetobacter sp.]MCH4089563.1 metallophosphoesterase [Acetobacter sp.]MCI1294719.1 metallophosphoesterase [Acetobacter sp.]MCI1321416.1 metallophosphoesterase [Acetobacter sp.]
MHDKAQHTARKTAFLISLDPSAGLVNGRRVLIGKKTLPDCGGPLPVPAIDPQVGNSILSAVLAHLSDLHLPFEIAPSPRELAGKRLLSLLSWRLRRSKVHLWSSLEAVMADIRAAQPDLLAISGDLTNLGLPEELENARKWLAGTGFAQTVIPGNHDAMVPMPWSHGPGSWSHHGGMVAPEQPLLRFAGEREDVAIIGLNSAIPTPPFFASGRVGPTQLDTLEGLLQRLGAQNICRVIMIHHPPHPNLVVRRKALEDWHRFSAVVASAGAELILHGHSHRGTITELPGTDIPLIGVTSASHKPDHPEKAAGWNHIAISRQETDWSISITRRRLGVNGHMASLPPVSFRRQLSSPDSQTA